MEFNRQSKLRLGFIVAAVVLVVKLFSIQILTDKYKIDARNNSVVYEIEYPSRGRIFDRNGDILVDNVNCYDINVTPKDVEAFDTLEFCRIFSIEPEYIREKMEYYRKYRTRLGYKNLLFLKDVPQDAYLNFSETQYMFPGFSVKRRTVRSYPFNAGGNLLGYVSEVDQNYISRHPGYKTGDYAGRTGMEAANEETLRGEKGYRIYYRDSRNRVLSSYLDGAEDKEAVDGQDITTTIDARLQQYGQQLMDKKRGSIIAIEPSTGEILTLVSSPGIDVSILSDIGAHWNEIVSNPDKPMFNRAVQASYPPGSVFKLVNGMIALQEGVLRPWMKYPCDEGYQYTSTRKLGCHHHYSPLDYEQAVMQSCNGYFCHVFKSVLENKAYASTEEAFRKWREYALSFGFGQPLGSDIPGELGGNIPTAERYNKTYGKGHWRFSSVISLSIGQGEIGATPLQIANLCATIANRGWYITPHIVRSEKFVRHETMVDSVWFNPTINGMWRAVNSPVSEGGTAALAAIPGLDVCGKTGTAQNPHGADNSVFICFAPREDPKIAVAVYVENAGFGATWASPIASLMVENYLTGEIAQNRKWLEDRVMTADLRNVPKNEPKKRQ